MSATAPKVFAACSCCGRNNRIAAVPAVDTRTGRRRTLPLCDDCRASRYRTWRLRYREEAAR